MIILWNSFISILYSILIALDDVEFYAESFFEKQKFNICK